MKYPFSHIIRVPNNNQFPSNSFFLVYRVAFSYIKMPFPLIPSRKYTFPIPLWQRGLTVVEQFDDNSSAHLRPTSRGVFLRKLVAIINTYSPRESNIYTLTMSRITLQNVITIISRWLSYYGTLLW